MLDKDFIITAELQPPKGPDPSMFIEKARVLKHKVHALNVTDNQRATLRLSSLAGCTILAREGITPVFQVTCRDRNRLAIQSDLLGAHALGIRHVLAITGDDISAGDHKEAKQVFDLDSIQLISIIDNMNKGLSDSGVALQGSTDFTIGAVVNPFSIPEELNLLRFDKKISAGARFFQTQAVYDIDGFKKFMDKVAGRNVKILAGILLLKSLRMAHFINQNVPGVMVPDNLMEELETSSVPLMKGMEIAARIIRELKGVSDGVHIMAMGMEERVPEILEMV